MGKAICRGGYLVKSVKKKYRGKSCVKNVSIKKRVRKGGEEEGEKKAPLERCCKGMGWSVSVYSVPLYGRVVPPQASHAVLQPILRFSMTILAEPSLNPFPSVVCICSCALLPPSTDHSDEWGSLQTGSVLTVGSPILQENSINSNGC